mmetsp:Transcript_84732/g.244955  ORF Transcript_84732/g.244955 Transcript_84732/m.244955 type:complete len:227 (-) Transcript_84732:382-1062(-)
MTKRPSIQASRSCTAEVDFVMTSSKACSKLRMTVHTMKGKISFAYIRAKMLDSSSSKNCHTSTKRRALFRRSYSVCMSSTLLPSRSGKGGSLQALAAGLSPAATNDLAVILSGRDSSLASSPVALPVLSPWEKPSPASAILLGGGGNESVGRRAADLKAPAKAVNVVRCFGLRGLGGAWGALSAGARSAYCFVIASTSSSFVSKTSSTASFLIFSSIEMKRALSSA